MSEVMEREVLQKVQPILLDMVREIDRVCRENGIRYILRQSRKSVHTNSLLFTPVHLCTGIRYDKVIMSEKAQRERQHVARRKVATFTKNSK